MQEFWVWLALTVFLSLYVALRTKCSGGKEWTFRCFKGIATFGIWLAACGLMVLTAELIWLQIGHLSPKATQLDFWVEIKGAAKLLVAYFLWWPIVPFVDGLLSLRRRAVRSDESSVN